METHQIKTQKTPTPIPVNTVQNTEFKGGPITKFAKLKLQVLGEEGGSHTESAKFYIAEIGKEDVILGTDWLLEHNPEVDWHAYGLHFTRCPPSCQIQGGLVKAKKATKKPGHTNPTVRRMTTMPPGNNYLIAAQKPGKGMTGQKVGNTTVPHLQTIPEHPEFTTQRLNSERLKARTRNYKAPTWAEEDVQEDGDNQSTLPSTDIKEDGVYLVRCLNTGILQALELYNDTKEGIDIHRAKTTAPSYAGVTMQRSTATTAKTGKQTKHTSSQRLAEEAAKGKPELSFEEIVPREYWNYRKVFEGRPKGQLPSLDPGITK